MQLEMMTKAWDTQNLLNRVKAKALPIAGLIAGDVVDWASESLKLSDKSYVKVLGGIVEELKEPLMKEIEKHIPKPAPVAASQPKNLMADVEQAKA